MNSDTPSPGNLQEQSRTALQRALDQLAGTQEEDGSWHGDYGGPMFLLPMFVALCHLSGRELSTERREGMRREFLSVRQKDGGIGLHREGPPCLFTTVLGYVSLRILGEKPEDADMIRMRKWIHGNGTPLGAAPWGKWILCLLGLYKYRGLNPIPPELWLLPRWFPLHPGRLWCHCRMVYLPASYLYARRASQKPDDLIFALREELYPEGWDSISFERHRNNLAAPDNVVPPRWPVRFANALLVLVEKLMPGSLRERALTEVLRQIDFEESVTNHIAIGPVNRVLNTISCFFDDPDGEAFAAGMESSENYLWQNGDRCLMQGYNNSKLWDTAFAAQAAFVAGAETTHPAMMQKLHQYIGAHQVLEDVPDRKRYYRERSRGGWPFSDLAHGWPISDCTAEGLKCAIMLARNDPSNAIPEDRLKDAVALLLDWQNPDGGWPTYEKQRAGNWMEWFNPSGVFGRIMVDYSYPECTSAVLQALAKAGSRLPDFKTSRIETSMRRGEAYLRREQRDDGSWEGSWGVCFTYGTWFGVSGLTACGAQPDDPALRKASQFLLEKQQENGSWGEEISSCSERQWIEKSGGHVVQTAWALLSLIRAGDTDGTSRERAVRFLLERQKDDGGWPHEGMVGMFNRTCAINYDWYRLYFPIWALAECLRIDPSS